jgi:cytochrome c biogenesis factor
MTGPNDKEKEFFPSGAILFFVLLLIFYAALVPALLDHDRAELKATTITQLEKRIFGIAVLFVMLFFGFAALALNLFHVGLPPA